MPATPASLLADLESLLRRAASRLHTRAWSAASETLNQAQPLLSLALVSVSPNDARLQRCQQLLRHVQERLVDDRRINREELNQIVGATRRLAPTRQAYAPRMTGSSQFGGFA